jgi:cob(I)alamin adenosyltransferase
MQENKGLIYVFTGEGKGKTSAALGVATRALLLEKKVIWIAFYKQESWGLAESKLKDKFPNLEMKFMGKGFRISKPLNQSTIKPLKIAKIAGDAVVVDTASEEEHKEAARASIEYAVFGMEKKPFLLVLDEVMNAVSDGLLDEKDVIEVLEKRGESHVILTGRHDPAKADVAGLLELADLVTECRKIKHPYDTGKLAVSGLDF